MRSKILKMDRYQKGEDEIVNTFPNAQKATEYILQMVKKH